jgi:hypothetical protein
MSLRRVGSLQFPVRLVDRSQQLVERRSFFDWPNTVESRSEDRKIVPGQQADGHDALVHGKGSAT